MKKIILIIGLFIISGISQAQWIKQLSPLHPVRDIEFINRYTGYRIYKQIYGLGMRRKFHL